MWAALPAIIKAIQTVLMTIGVTWFAFTLQREGAVDKAAQAIGSVAGAAGGVAQATEKGAGALGKLDSTAILLFGLAAILLLRK